jgi:hypothetical protein
LGGRVSNQDEQGTPGVVLLSVIELPEKGRVVIQFGPLVTDRIKTALAAIGALAETIPMALDQERAEGRKPASQILRVPPGTRIKH